MNKGVKKAPRAYQEVAALTGGVEEVRRWHCAAIARATAEMEEWTGREQSLAIGIMAINGNDRFEPGSSRHGHDV